MFDLWIRCSSFHAVDSLAERSKAPDASSGGAIRVGSNPTAVILSFDLSLVGPELEKKRSWADLNRHRWIQSPEC